MDVIIIGNLGQNPRKREVNGDHVVDISVASDLRVKKTDGEWLKLTRWYDCSFWGKRGDSIAKYLRKGSKVQVIGELELRQYESEGETKTAYSIRQARVQFLANFGDDQRDATRPSGDDIPF